jgi:hypothetical protein
MKRNDIARATIALVFCVFSVGLSSQAPQQARPDHRDRFAKYKGTDNLRDGDLSKLADRQEPIRMVRMPGHGDIDPSTFGFTPVDFLRRYVCAADAVVVATPRKSSSDFTADGTFIFTDYELEVETVVRGDNTLPATRILLAWPGGTLLHKGREITTTDGNYGSLVLSGRYLLFLHQIAAGDFETIRETAGFNLTGERAGALGVGALGERLNAQHLVTLAQAVAADCAK